ncbi:MAG: adenylate cyclase [Paracoccaceae bacterium]|jgi:adenylate cyclase
MNIHAPTPSASYGIDIQPLIGRVTAHRNGVLLASSARAKVMYETRLGPTVYFPAADVTVVLGGKSELQTFCPFKGTANYRDLRLDGAHLRNVVWSYDDALPESAGIQGYVGFMSTAGVDLDLGENTLADSDETHISGPLIDWLLRKAASIPTPEDLTAALVEKLTEHGIAISRFSVLIWSQHPQIAGMNYIWNKDTGTVTTFAPSYEIYDHPSFLNSPLMHVSRGLGGVRQKLDDAHFNNSFPVMQDLKDGGATDYVAMPLPFSDGRTNVLTMTCDHPDGFSTANLGLVFECSAVISRFYEVFTQKENARSLLETYVGKRTGARVLGGEFRRGDGDDIDAAIMFCDLRGSTRLEEILGRADYITLLNQFFETTSTIIQDHNGEVLKFIGDAVLAVFPAGSDAKAARAQALQSARDIVARLDELRLVEDGHDYDCSIGIAYGRVTYGNVGSKDRLDFTVIGQAANIAARLGDYGKTIGHRIVVSGDIAGADANVTDLGAIALHNVSRPVESFAVQAEA